MHDAALAQRRARSACGSERAPMRRTIDPRTLALPGAIPSGHEVDFRSMTRRPSRRSFAVLVACGASFALHACDGSPSQHDLGGGGAADAAPDQASDAAATSPCDTIGLTGAAPRCKVFAFCSSGDYELDCNRDDARCVCRTVTGKGRSDVAYDPGFCSLPDGDDPSQTSEALAAMFARVVQACEWTP